jgi:hypothetical protein
MDVATPEGLALEAMVGKPVEFVSTTKPALSDIELAKTVPTAMTMANVKHVVSHVVFRLTFVFFMTFGILVAINPPFVQVRNEKKNPIEASPCSYGRVIIAAAIVTLLVGAIPLCIKHKDKFATVVQKIKGWRKSGSSI